MAGLFAARVLSDYFGEVVLVDRDDIPSSPSPPWGGVRQGKPFHALLTGGLNVANEPSDVGHPPSALVLPIPPTSP